MKATTLWLHSKPQKINTLEYLCRNIALKTIEFVHIKELFRKLPISTYDLINYYEEEVVTFRITDK